MRHIAHRPHCSRPRQPPYSCSEENIPPDRAANTPKQPVMQSKRIILHGYDLPPAHTLDDHVEHLACDPRLLILKVSIYTNLTKLSQFDLLCFSGGFIPQLSCTVIQRQLCFLGPLGKA